ncbi:MAG: hypothetical protein ACYTGB_02235 [Planctomycetota bacterium]
MKLPAAALALLLAAALNAAASAGDDKETGGGDGGKAGEGEKLALIVDHLPPLMYTEERLSFSFRVERRQGLVEKIPFTVSWHFSRKDGGGKLAAGSADRRTEERFTIVRGSVRVPKGARHFHYTLSSGGQTLAASTAVLLGEKDPWPKGAAAGWDGIAVKGRPVILTLEERVARVDDRWKPIKWIWEKGRANADSVVVAGPPLCPPGVKGYRELLGEGNARIRFLEVPAAPAENEAGGRLAQGIYRLIETVERGVVRGGGPRPDLVVLVVPPDDPETATNHRLYRQGLDWVLARLWGAGIRRVGIVPPLTRKVPARQLETYAQACRESSRIYEQKCGSRFIDPAALLADEYWRPEGALGKVTASRPNARGQQKLAEIIGGACK